VLKTALALLDPHESQIQWHHLPDDIQEELHTLRYQQDKKNVPPPQNLQELSVVAIQKALENARGNVSAAARQLGISRQTLYRKLQSVQTQ
jgi:sigma-54 dependent transcriptional regulator, acetoin dehydrogenase operon transcriptional activator AcoR